VPSIPAIRATRKCLSVFRDLEFEMGKVKIVVNRVGKKDKIGIDEVEKILEYPVSYSLPNNYKAVIQAIDTGLPLVGQKRLSDVGKQIIGMARGITNGDFSGKILTK
ncbi:MAG: CpaE family protein, partial [Candidatus Thorarchaeota archaeon]